MTHYPIGDSFVVILAGEIDIDIASEIELALSDAGRFGASRVVIDVSQVVFADSTVLHLLLSAARRYELRLVGPLHPSVRRLLDVTGTAAHFPVDPDLDTALHR
ncbi:STAS domain-containing protein [Streptomyces sp. NPDC088400]|uniref:STAS domain-containing protein n=1 Tax=Streptomyces sp. NPDC088400 TaxID=3365861 RepID=UPI00380068EB